MASTSRVMPVLPRGTLYFLANLLVTGLLLAHTVTACPKDCACYNGDHGPMVSCRYQPLEQVPADIPTDTVELDMGHTSLTTIDRDTFPVLPALRHLKLDWCRIEDLGSRAFSNSPNLEVLRLSNNRLTQLYADSFTGLSQLRVLHLDYNQIRWIPRAVFRELRLEELLLHSNSLESLEDSVFEGSSVVNLNLDENNISNISIQLFKPLKSSLKNLNLSHNAQPLTMEEHVFSGFNFSDLRISYDGLKDASFLKHVKAQTLDISGHAFSSLDFREWDNLRQTREFYLRNLSITTLNESILANLVSVTLLDLSENHLVTLDGDVFRFTPNLKVLRLDYNRFMSLPENLGLHLRQLEVLKVPWNNLAVVRADAFEGLTELRELDIRNNLIQVMEPSMEHILDGLESVMIGGNPIHCNCEMRWFRRWLETSRKETGVEDCRSPSEVRGYIYSIPVELFVCRTPQVMYITGDQNVNEGSDVFLTCRAEGDPAPEVQWSSPTGETVSVTPPFNRTKHSTSAIWHMSRIHARDGGWFKCRASNRQGVTESYTYIHVVSPGGVTIDVNLLTRPTISSTTAESTTATTTVTEPETTTSTTELPSTSTTGVPETTSSVPASSPAERMTSSVANKTAATKQITTVAKTTPTTSESTTSVHIPLDTSDYTVGTNEKLIVKSFEPWKVAVIVSCILGAILVFSGIGICVYHKRKGNHKGNYDINLQQVPESNEPMVCNNNHNSK